MQIPCRVRLASLCLAASLAPALLVLTLPDAVSSHDNALTTAASPQQVADALDGIIQPRFQDLSAGKFGITRLVPAVQGHRNIGSLGYFRTNTPAEAALLARADAAQRPYVIAFLHSLPPPSATIQTSATSAFSPYLSTITVKGVPAGYPADYLHLTEPLLQAAVVKALPQAQLGKPTQAKAGNWVLFLRPVTASQQACLTCHTTANRGDMLGVMVYAVGRNTGKL